MKNPYYRLQQNHDKSFYSLIRFAILLMCIIFCVADTTEAAKVTSLQVEYSDTPIGIDVQKPRFSWQMLAPEGERGYLQTAYQIQVKNSKGSIIWDSGKVSSGASVTVPYSGQTLQSTTRYNWAVTVWDQNGDTDSESSWFETGLMNPDQKAWSGAQWIGGPSDDLVLYSHYLSVFKVKYSVQLDEASESTKAGFVLGANDHRLLNKNMNLYGIESDRNEHYIKFEMTISDMDDSETGKAKMNVYRVGYHPDDSPCSPLLSIDIPHELIHLKNKYQSHRIVIESVFGTVNIYINGTEEVNRIGEIQHGFFGKGGININPMGSGGDYISFPMLADIGFSMDPGQKAVFSNLVVKNFRKPSNALFREDPSLPNYQGIFAEYAANIGSGLTITNRSYKLDGGSNGIFIVADPSRNAMPMLRTEFNLKSKEIEKARLYITARGIYEVYLNGKQVGRDYFNPGLTQYNKTHMYQTYDVTDMMHAGDINAIGVWLGEGWWSGNYTFNGENWNFFGDRQSLLAKLVITCIDGSQQVITTNDRDWKYYDHGPVIYGSLFQGEVYDATREAEMEGWTRPGFNDGSWKNAVVVDLKGTAYTGNTPGLMGPGIDIEYDDFNLFGQIGENAGVIKILTAQNVTEPRPGVFVYDMGQNMVGVPKITINDCQAGDKIRLRYAEVLYPDLEEYKGNIGMVMLENIRAAYTQDLYILKDGVNTIQPHFTFHGFRYIEITGIDHPLPLNNVQGLVISSIKQLNASYKTSNEKVNRLFENIVWSLYGNFLSIPTDCPQRNERMGWSGDISVFSRTATYLANVDQFFRKHMLAMRDIQSNNGRFTDVAPVDFGFGGILWGSAGMTVAWETYQQYGDLGLLEEHYDAMKKYMDFLNKGIDETTGLQTEGYLGDWLSPEVYQNDNSLLFTAYHIYNLEIMAETGDALGKMDDASYYKQLRQERIDQFNKIYVDPETHKTIKSSYRPPVGIGMPPTEEPEGGSAGKLMDTQASYAVPLALNAFSQTNAPLAAKHLAETVKRQNEGDDGAIHPPYSLMTGFIGTAWICKALSDYGYSDIAYRLLQQETYPSWLYPVTQGATTIWERLNSYTHKNGFSGNNSMNSFNHYSFGAAGQWMIAYSLGIQRAEPGFKNFILQPEPDPTGQMTWAKGYYDSMYGKIKSAWKVENGRLSYTATVPANTTATLYIPALSEKTVKEGNKFAEQAKGVRFIKFGDGKAVYELQSGDYEFESQLQD